MSEPMATTYRFVRGEPPTIDGVTIPWAVSAEPGPRVEAWGPIHILWLPVVVDAPMPTLPEGRPDGEPLPVGDPR